jgi:hypothetical protein
MMNPLTMATINTTASTEGRERRVVDATTKTLP